MTNRSSSRRPKLRQTRTFPFFPLIILLIWISACSQSTVIGPVEPVVLCSAKSSREIKAEAKIDTGAYSSSIDRSLAIELGFSDAIEFFDSFGLDRRFTPEEIGKLKSEGIKEQLAAHPDIGEAVFVYSSNGISLRIKLPIIMRLAGKEIKSLATVADRSNLKYPVLVGIKDLEGFLIDPSKKREMEDEE